VKEGKGEPPSRIAKVQRWQTLKCGGPPEENRGPWSKKFANRWPMSLPSCT